MKISWGVQIQRRSSGYATHGRPSKRSVYSAAARTPQNSLSCSAQNLGWKTVWTRPGDEIIIPLKRRQGGQNGRLKDRGAGKW